MTKLSTRLQQIFDLVEENHTFIDVGCDHGFLDIALAKKYPDARIIASDINENALKNAKKYSKSSSTESNFYYSK